MEIASSPLRVFFLCFAFAVFTGSESNVRNLSCDCSGRNVSDHCPKSAWSISGQNWFELCQYEGNEFCTLKAAVILPENTSYVTALPKVLPALSLAVEEAKRREILPRGLKFLFSAYDDQCKAVYGQMHAIEAYANKKPHVIFGPSCEYSVAAVARMVRFWNIPLLTAGALTYDFAQNKTSCKNEYHLLVRTGIIDFQEISNFILQILHSYDWNKVALMYMRDGYAEISGSNSCKLMMETLVNTLKKENISYNPIDMRMTKEDEIKKYLESREFLSDYSDAASPDHSLQIFRRVFRLNLEKRFPPKQKTDSIWSIMMTCAKAGEKVGKLVLLRFSSLFSGQPPQSPPTADSPRGFLEFYHEP